MTELERRKLQMYRDMYSQAGLMPANSREALAMAVATDDTQRSLGPFDIASPLFASEARTLLDIAELLEKEENARGKAA